MTPVSYSNNDAESVASDLNALRVPLQGLNTRPEVNCRERSDLSPDRLSRCVEEV